MMWCIATGAAPGNSQRLYLELLVLQDRTWLSPWEAQAGPRRPLCIGTQWKFASWNTSKPPCSNRLAKQLLSEGSADVESLSGEFIRSAERKLVGAMSHIYVISSTLWKFKSIQLIQTTRTSLFSPYRIKIKIFLPPNFGTW